MFEILIVNATYYAKGAEVWPTLLQGWAETTHWWLDPTFSKENAVTIMPRDGIHYQLDYGVMNCEAIRFDFDFCPNPLATHHDISALHDVWNYENNNNLFDDSIPLFVEAVKKRLLNPPSGYIEFTFFWLYEVDVEEYRGEDGGLDSLEVIPTPLGEIDLATLGKTMAQEHQ